jgi:hypothetical protein
MIDYIALAIEEKTIAACCQFVDNPEPVYINLQEYAAALLGVDEEIIDYLMIEKNGEKVKSPKLRNLISLENRRQPKNLPLSHAKLNFIDNKGNKVEKDGRANYRRSLFGYFYKKGQSLVQDLIPNPRLLFQAGSERIIPEVESIGSKFMRVRHKPEELIKHLLAQVIRNFVLRSSTLRNRKTRKNLILVIPNVCSLTLAQSIRKLVNQNTQIDNIDILYETEALAYYVLDAKHRYPQVDNFITDMRKLRNIDSFQILSVNFGHSTIDLSVIELIEQRHNDLADLRDEYEKRPRFFVKARIGKSGGIQKLKYILAEYYNMCLKEVLDRSEFKALRLPFDFLEVVGGGLFSEQPLIVEASERFIDAVIKNMDENLEIKLKKEEHERYIDAIVDKWFDAVSGGLSERERWEIKQLWEVFRQEIKKTFFLDKLAGLSLRATKKNKLKKEIEKFINENSKELIKNLGELVVSRENIDAYPRYSLKLLQRLFKKTLVVVTGEGLQFKPIKKAIYNEIVRLNIPRKYICFLTGAEAKEACCKGAIVYKRSGWEWGNPGELFGTYGFISANGEMYRILDTRELNKGSVLLVEFNKKATYWFFYSPLAYHTFSRDHPPRLFDGSTALLKYFKDITKFRIKSDDEKLVIRINDTHTVRLATYGDITEPIYPKVWPQYLKPRGLLV